MESLQLLHEGRLLQQLQVQFLLQVPFSVMLPLAVPLQLTCPSWGDGFGYDFRRSAGLRHVRTFCEYS